MSRIGSPRDAPTDMTLAPARFSPRLLVATLGLAAALGTLALIVLGAWAMIGGPRLIGHGAVTSDLFVDDGVAPRWAPIFVHNLGSLAALSAAPIVAALLQARPGLALGTKRDGRSRSADLPARIHRDALIVAAGVVLVVVLEEGGILAALCHELSVAPARIVPVLADHHGIVELTALSLPLAALLACRARARRRQLPWLLPAAVAVAIGLLLVAAHIEAGSAPGAVRAAVAASSGR